MARPNVVDLRFDAAGGGRVSATNVLGSAGSAPAEPSVAAADETVEMYNREFATQEIDVLSNDSGVGLEVTKVGDLVRPDQDGIYSVSGSNGGCFRIDRLGEARFFDEGDFDTLPKGRTKTSSVSYVATDQNGVTASSTLTAKISADPYRSGDPYVIDNPAKIGLGVHEVKPPGYEREIDYYNSLGAGWYYNWWYTPVAGPTGMDYVPMIWGDYVTDEALREAVAQAITGTLLGFNEPDVPNQADMSVERALELWPRLESTGLRLGSPAPGKEVLSEDSWLARFMAGVAQRGLRVDFLALHTYTRNPDVSTLEDYLIEVYQKYRLPIWITELALVDFGDWGRFSYADNARFLTDAFLMLDDLDFVERYSWFAPVANGDGLGIQTSFLDPEGRLTAVGSAYRTLLAGEAVPHLQDDTLASEPASACD